MRKGMKDELLTLLAGVAIFLILGLTVFAIVVDEAKMAKQPSRWVSVRSVEYPVSTGKSGSVTLAVDDRGDKYRISENIAVQIAKGQRNCITEGAHNRLVRCEVNAES